MANSSAGQWVKFFNACGIPSPSAATYAHIFVENRIQTDMLMDLNKDYLREMKITPLGDIIAILRHAKNVSDQTAREKVLNTETTPAAPVPIAPMIVKPLLGINSTATKVNAEPFLHRTQPVRPTITKKSKHERKDSTNKSKVFNRLSTIPTNSHKSRQDEDPGDDSMSTDSTDDVRVQIAGKNDVDAKPINNLSIFQRLGGKSHEKSYPADIDGKFKQINRNVDNSRIITNTNILDKPKSMMMNTQKPNVVVLRRELNETRVSLKGGFRPNIDNEDYLDDDNVMDVEYISDHQQKQISTNTNSGANKKIVKFCPTVEVFDLPNQKQNFKVKTNKRFTAKTNETNHHAASGGNVKARLGLVSKLKTVKKSYSFKASPPKTKISPVKAQAIRMKSDELLMKQEKSIHQRLGVNADNNSSRAAVGGVSSRLNKSGIITTTTTTHNAKKNLTSTTTTTTSSLSSSLSSQSSTKTSSNRTSMSSISQRIGKVNISKRNQTKQPLATTSPLSATSKSSSVFDRLGYNG